MVNLAAANPNPVPLTVFFLTFASAVVTIAAASHALVERNHDVGQASYTASLAGIYLIVSTNSLTRPGYALTVAAGSIVINTLTLLLASAIGLPHFLRKNILPILLHTYFNLAFIIAISIVVFYQARTGQLGLYATVIASGIVVPGSLLEAQAGAEGLTLDFWGKGYAKFMAISGIVTAGLSIPTVFFAHRYYQFVKVHEAEAQGIRAVDQENGLGNVSSREKPVDHE